MIYNSLRASGDQWQCSFTDEACSCKKSTAEQKVIEHCHVIYGCSVQSLQPINFMVLRVRTWCTAVVLCYMCIAHEYRLLECKDEVVDIKSATIPMVYVGDVFPL